MTPASLRFAMEWIETWNTHDLDGVLSHYSPTVRFSSPVALDRVPGSRGVLEGVEALREYWGPALEAMPDLHFELEDVLDAVGGCTIIYRNQRGQRVAETMLFGPDGKIAYGLAAYASVTSAAA